MAFRAVVAVLLCAATTALDPDHILPEDIDFQLPAIFTAVPKSILSRQSGARLSEFELESLDESDGEESADIAEQTSTHLAALLLESCQSDEFRSYKAWVRKLCDALSEPVTEALHSALGSLADAAFISYDDNSITFSVGSVTVSNTNFRYLI